MAVSGTNQRIADRLLTEGRIQKADHTRAIEYANRNRERIEEALIFLEILSEADLLKYIATVHATRFVSTEKLSKAAIEPKVLAKVTRKVADLHGVFPVLFDEANKILSVVTPDPDNGAALHEIKLAAGVKDVKALVARPAAVRAAIQRHYGGDLNAFAPLLKATNALAELMNYDPFDRGGAGGTSSQPVFVRTSAAPPSAKAGPISRAAAPIPPPQPSAPTPPPQIVVVPPTQTHEFIETLNVLVSLLENSRPDLRGHSSTVARLTKKTCERIGLGPLHVAAFVGAAYLHDLGKMGTYHLTALNVAEYEGHRAAARKAAELPVQLMASVGLTFETAAAIHAMYERYDGQGFPQGQAGKEIPLGARVLAVTDTYADLTQNPRNPYRKILKPAEACDVLLQYRGAIFDPNIVDLFRTAMTGDDLRQKLLADRHQALIIDPDPADTTVLELRMIEQGFEVRIARTALQARRDLETSEIAVVVSEIDLDEPDAGLALRTDALNHAWGRDLTWVVLTRKTDRQTAQRAFDLGVDDVVSKPASTDIFVAKLRQLIERRSSRSGGRGVSGSLAEMSLPDMVQVLWHGRKTCALKIQSHGQSGEIQFAEGQVYNAQFASLRGEEAFYKMLTLHEGDFRLDPNYKPSVRAITASPEALLLEGMRRLDESATSTA